MRAHLKTQTNGYLSADKISLSLYIKYYSASKSTSGFRGGKTYSHYSNSTLERSLVNFSEKTYSNQLL